MDERMHRELCEHFIGIKGALQDVARELKARREAVRKQQAAVQHAVRSAATAAQDMPDLPEEMKALLETFSQALQDG